MRATKSRTRQVIDSAAQELEAASARLYVLCEALERDNINPASAAVVAGDADDAVMRALECLRGKR